MDLSLILSLSVIFLLLLNLLLLIILCSKNSRRNSSEDAEKITGIIHKELSEQRTEINHTFGMFSQVFNNQQEMIRKSVETKLGDIQKQNEAQMEKMRRTVDENLHRTLETRLGQSFREVSEQLAKVQMGLGEMKNLAADVGGLKNVLSNVKTKGVLGEYQLAAILEQVLTAEQYALNVKTKPASRDFVEFAVRLPSRSKEGDFIWLPLDAKFPTEDYIRMIEANNAGDKSAAADYAKLLERKIRVFAKDIHDKYIEPPYTTDFALMFLPFEGLYAEVLRIPGLFESIQRDYKVCITGPTTVAAFLNSLQMGFRTLAVEKRTSEVWALLNNVRNEFSVFGEVLAKTKARLEAATKEIEDAGTKSRRIERSLKDVEGIPPM